MNQELPNHLPFSLKQLPTVRLQGKVLLYSPFCREIIAVEPNNLSEVSFKSWLGERAFFPAEVEVWSPTLQMNDVVLCVSTKCNLNCGYCSAASNIAPRNMSPSLAISALDIAIRESGGHPLRVLFIGGEPTLNFNCITECIRYLDSRRATYYPVISTNGIFSQEIMSYLAEHRFNILISMDSANPLIQNTLRPKRSFVRGALGILNATQHTEHVCIRATVTQLSVKGLCDLVDMCGDLGVESIVVAPIRTELGRGKRVMNLRPRIGEYIQAILDAMARSIQIGLKFSEPLIAQHLSGKFVARQSFALLPNGEISVAGPAADRPAESVIGHCGPHGDLNLYEDRISRLGSRYFENSQKHCSNCMALAICRGQARRYDFLFKDPSLEPTDDYYCRLNRKLTAGFIRKMWEGGGKSRQQQHVDGHPERLVFESLTLPKSELEYVV